jgi:glutaminyl-peptide cyclotransferase
MARWDRDCRGNGPLENLAFVYDLETFDILDTLRYEGEGWGLCFDGEALYLSNGSPTLFRRDPVTFQILDEIQVNRAGIPVGGLNELECDSLYVYANVFMEDDIIWIGNGTGRVLGGLDAVCLSSAVGRSPDPGAVLNGIASNPSTGTFFLTGKLWDALFEVEILR